MATDVEMEEGSITSIITDSLVGNQGLDALSPEDVAWADSCLVKDPEVSDVDWSSVKDALLEILSSQPESQYSPPVSDALPEGTDVELPPSAEPASVLSLRRTNGDSIPDGDTETNNDELTVEGDIGVFLSQPCEVDGSETSLKNAFLPTYKEEDDQRMTRPIDSEFDPGVWENEMEPPIDDIFRVWDLGIPAETDDLVEQLNKALTETFAQSMPSAFDDSGVWKDLKDLSLDAVIAGIGDLSLNRHSA
ncbi:hypothetical protein Tsubulata_022154 [Turnera subulata]|uniref:Uncharacterized protein n=1 Tax=Turnera subulata TaxID=218843 RepID=A0A9Q0FUZ5_9ROSI|nr:hypothetical protein Tsubulata_022154 [Turnera subulata]